MNALAKASPSFTLRYITGKSFAPRHLRIQNIIRKYLGQCIYMATLSMEISMNSLDPLKTPRDRLGSKGVRGCIHATTTGRTANLHVGGRAATPSSTGLLFRSLVAAPNSTNYSEALSLGSTPPTVLSWLGHYAPTHS